MCSSLMSSAKNERIPCCLKQNVLYIRNEFQVPIDLPWITPLVIGLGDYLFANLDPLRVARKAGRKLRGHKSDESKRTEFGNKVLWGWRSNALIMHVRNMRADVPPPQEKGTLRKSG